MSIKRQSAWGLVPVLVTAAVGFISMPLTLRFLGSDMFAVWTYVSIFSGMFGFADMGLGVTVGRYIGVALGRNDHASVRSYWGTGNAVMLPFLALVSLVFVGLGAWLGPQWFKVSAANVTLLRECFAAGGLGLFLNYYATYWLTLSQAHLDFKFVSLLRTGSNLASVVPSIALAWLTHNPLCLIGWSVLVSLLQLVIFIVHSRRKYDLGFDLRAASVARLREMAVYVGKTFLNLLTGALFNGVDRVILGKLALPLVFNPYVMASNMATRLQSFSVAIMGPVFFNTSRVAEGNRESAAKIYDEVFTLLTDWYLLAALWIGLWQPVLLRVWLAHTLGPDLWADMAARVAPLLVPLVIACCITSLANISSAQLTPLNRVGTAMGFNVAAGLLAIVGVWTGWHYAGVIGSAYGFLFSRIVYLAQDLFTLRLIRARGWLNPAFWLRAGAQVLVAAGFATAYLFFQPASYWLLLFAAAHAGLVSAWLLRQPLRKLLTHS